MEESGPCLEQAREQETDRSQVPIDSERPFERKPPAAPQAFRAARLILVLNVQKPLWRHPQERGGKIVPLALFKDEAQYKPRFDYNGIIERAYDIRASREYFALALEREVKFQISNSAQTMTPKQAQVRTFRPYLPNSRTPYGIAKYSETVRGTGFLQNTPSPWKPRLDFVK
jgi:hypothetical protein